MISIDEQIAQAKLYIKGAAFYESESIDVEKAILASLERLKKIDAAVVPDELGEMRDRAEAAEAKLAAIEKQVLDYGGSWDLSECKSKLAAIELELARLNGDIPYGN